MRTQWARAILGLSIGGAACFPTACAGRAAAPRYPAQADPPLCGMEVVEAMAAPCWIPPARSLGTNDDLAHYMLDLEAAFDECRARIDAIRAWASVRIDPRENR